MSRAYRIRVKESLARDIHAEDCIETKLEVLEVLPREQMSELLADELKRRGFEEQEDGTLARRDEGVTVVVNPCSGEVVVRAQTSDQAQVEGTREGFGYNDVGPSRQAVEKRLEKELIADLEKRVDEHEEKLQKKTSERLERELDELRPELREAVERVTAEALKQKAAQMGQIKEISEDQQAGSLTIKVEV
jgi:hypothetical protein